MKKSSMVVIAAAIVVLLAGTVIGVSTGLFSGGAEDTAAGKADIQAKIELPENPSTGYAWFYTLDDESIVEVTKDEYVEPKADTGVVGAAGTHIWEFKGLKEGKTVMKLDYYRSWEGVGESAESHEYEISVDSSGKVDINKIK